MLHNSVSPGEGHGAGESAKPRIAWNDSISEHEFLKQPLRYIAASLESGRGSEDPSIAVLPAKTGQVQVSSVQFKGPTLADRIFQFGSSSRVGSGSYGEIVAPTLRALGVVGVLFALGWTAHAVGLFKIGGEPIAGKQQVRISAAEPSLVSGKVQTASAEAAALPEDLQAMVSAQRLLPTPEEVEPAESQPREPAPAAAGVVSRDPEPKMAVVEPAIAEPAVETVEAVAKSVSTEPANVDIAQAASETPDPLSSTDPRWGHDVVQSQGMRGMHSDPTGSASKPELALAELDGGNTGSAEAAVAVLNAMAIPTPEPAPDKAVRKKSAAKSNEGQTGKSGARIRTAVKMRSGPDNGNRVIGVVPANASVRVLQCKIWCKIAWNGKQGYVFNKFVIR